MSRTSIPIAVLSLLFGAASALPAQKSPPTHPVPAATATPSMAEMMRQMSGMHQRVDSMSLSLKHGGNGAMGGMSGMSGMMAMGVPQHAMGQMADHVGQMLGNMQRYMGQMQTLMQDSSIAHNPAMMRNLQRLQQHMGAIMAAMAPMIATMQQMHQHMGMSLPRFSGRVSDRSYAAASNCASYAAGLT